MSSSCQSSDLLEKLTASLRGTKVSIDPEGYKWDLKTPYALDCETDEHDNCVGIGLWNGTGPIVYLTSITRLPLFLKIFGHNIKFDWHWLNKWKYPLQAQDIITDTILMSYVYNPTREKHGLKILSEEILKNPYPHYKDVVFGRNRMTLNKQPIEITSTYCANDVKATYDLYTYFNRRLTTSQRAILNNVELPLMKLLFKMEELGIQVDVKYLQKLEKEFDGMINEVVNRIGAKDVNLNSPKQVKEWLEGYGIKLKSTDKKFLSEHTNKFPIKDLLEYRELQKLQTTYVQPLQESERCKTEFNQLINTGRLSSRNPNLQNIPTKTERGNLLRKAFVAKKDHILLDFDYSQIEYRLLAHFTQEPILLEAYKNGKDIHQETAGLLGVGRYVGKTLNFAAIYGAQAKKIAQTVNSSKEGPLTNEQAEEFLKKYWQKLPRVKYWSEKTKEEAKSKKAFRTLSGQYYPLAGIDSSDRLIRWHAERQAVNGTIQGSAAYIIKLAMLELEKQKYVPVLQIHDELLFEEKQCFCDFDNCRHDDVIRNISNIMENVVKLSVPLVVECGIGINWEEAKK